MAATKKMLFVLNAAGKIVAAAHPGTAQASGVNVGIRPLPGQRLVEVEVPEELTRLTSGHAFHHALSRAALDPGTGTVRFRQTRVRKAKHP